MPEPPVHEANCRCCGGFCGHGPDPQYCGACIRAGEPPDEWVPPAQRVAEKGLSRGGLTRTSLVKLRGYEFEEVVPWADIIGVSDDG